MTNVLRTRGVGRSENAHPAGTQARPSLVKYMGLLWRVIEWYETGFVLLGRAHIRISVHEAELQPAII